MPDTAESVPPLELTEAVDNTPSERDNYEHRRLETEAKHRENLIREADQRYNLRKYAISLATLVMMGMSFLLYHINHSFLILSVPPSAIVAALIAPIISITTLALAILIAAFRGYRKEDEKDSINALSTVTRIGNSLS